MKIRSLLIGGAVGAAAVYFLDPVHGNARRARAQARALWLAQDLQERARIALAGLDGPLTPRPDDDLSLLSRVEGALHRVPDVQKGSVETEVLDGRVVLRGEATSVQQERELVEAAGRVPGVAGVESLLRVLGASRPDR